MGDVTNRTGQVVSVVEVPEEGNKLYPVDDLSVATPKFPNMDRRVPGDNAKDVRESHGYTADPRSLLTAQLESLEEEAEDVDIYWKQFQPSSSQGYGPEIKTDIRDEERVDVSSKFRDVSYERPMLQEDFDGASWASMASPPNGDVELSKDASEFIDLDAEEGGAHLTENGTPPNPKVADLLSPLSLDQIRSQRKKARARGDGPIRGRKTTYKTVIRVFLIGVALNADDEYDYVEDIKSYESIHDDVVNQRAILAYEHVHEMPGRGCCKILMKVLYPEVTDQRESDEV